MFSGALAPPPPPPASCLHPLVSTGPSASPFPNSCQHRVVSLLSSLVVTWALLTYTLPVLAAGLQGAGVTLTRRVVQRLCTRFSALVTRTSAPRAPVPGDLAVVTSPIFSPDLSDVLRGGLSPSLPKPFGARAHTAPVSPLPAPRTPPPRPLCPLATVWPPSLLLLPEGGAPSAADLTPSTCWWLPGRTPGVKRAMEPGAGLSAWCPGSIWNRRICLPAASPGNGSIRLLRPGSA